MEEKRKFIRLELPIEVKYRISIDPVVENKSLSKDISAGGLRMILKEKLPPGLLLEIKINIPDDERLISTSGEIVWQDEIVIDREVKYETGIRFVNISTEDREKISRYIRKELNQRAKEDEE